MYSRGGVVYIVTRKYRVAWLTRPNDSAKLPAVRLFTVSAAPFAVGELAAGSIQCHGLGII